VTRAFAIGSLTQVKNADLGKVWLNQPENVRPTFDFTHFFK
jgi:hypothetical protein